MNIEKVTNCLAEVVAGLENGIFAGRKISRFKDHDIVDEIRKRYLLDEDELLVVSLALQRKGYIKLCICKEDEG
jgi:hypothetical protein